jgi:hypothetical protein
MTSDRERSQILLISAALGALVGLAAGYTLIKRAEEEGRQPTLTAREGLSLGMLVAGLLRQVSQLGDGE